MPAQLTESVILAAIDGFEAQKARIDQQIAALRALLPGRSKAGATTTEAGPKKRHFSPEAIERMRAAQRLRWSKIRGESQPSTPAPAEAPKPKRKLSAAAKAKLIANLKKARAAKAAKARAAVKRASPARKKTAAKKAVKKAAAAKKTTAPAPAPSVQAAG
jgi:hypothetical protein